MMTFSRRSFLKASASGVFSLAAGSLFGGNAPSEKVRLGLIGCGGRGRFLSTFFPQIQHLELAAFADPDTERLAEMKKSWPDVPAFTDMRSILDDPNIDAVLIATCNHWHCPAAVQAMLSGKDVYVEKPLGMNFREGRAVVDASKKYGKICQIGTQMRSDPVFHPEVQRFLHEEKNLGEIRAVRVNRFFARKPIGLRQEPLVIPETVDADLWFGPAEMEPLYRSQLQYDWHWMWRTGHGEMGNWGAHLLDDCRNDIFQDKIRMPKRVLCGGGRVGYGDAGQTPNSAFALFDTGSIPVIFSVSNLPDKDNPKTAGTCPGPTSGYIAYCEGGRYEKFWGGASAFDADGKEIRKFEGTSERDGCIPHLQSFIDAVRNRDKSLLAAPIETGYDSSAWYNGANTAYRLAEPFSREKFDQAADSAGVMAGALADLEKHLVKQGVPINADTFKISGFLAIDEENERFTGNMGDAANRLMEITYREKYGLPEIFKKES